MRRFVVIGQRASASPDFSLVDLAGTSGRLDVLVRCLRASLLVSHGLRRDTRVYLVLRGGAAAPRVLRVAGDEVRFLRPDERALAVLVQKSLRDADERGRSPSFVTVRPGVAVADGDLDVVLADLPPGASLHVLEPGGEDVREAPLDLRDPVVFVGDHRGFDPATRERLRELGATALGVGPVALHADDAIAQVTNELDRRHARAVTRPE